MSKPSMKLPLPVSPGMSPVIRKILSFRPNILQTYLMQQNIYLATLCIGVGTCIYLLQDLVETLDAFVYARVGLGVIFGYFISKLPLILSQILPAAYLISLIVQIGLLVRHRELLALQAGGVSYGSLVRFFCAYGLIWCVLQLFLSQGLGVMGQRTMDRIWQEKVRKEESGPVAVEDVWFLSGPYVVNVGWANPQEGHGRGVSVYEYGEGNTLLRIIRAGLFSVHEQGWELREVDVHETTAFRSFQEQSLLLDIRQDLEAFAILQARFEPGALSLWHLGRIISYLEGAGSNVERLRTAWHMKWAYAFSLFVMTLIALALATMIDNVYANIALGLGIVFVYYVLFVLGVSLGERGFVSPFIGAWLGNILFGLLSGFRLLWYLAPEDLSFLKK